MLARKLRPSGFDALVGQDHVVRALSHALDNDRLHHAYLFTGTRGVGKTTIARILAKALNCERGVSANPCGECSICLEVKENRFIDLIEVDAASRTGVDNTRELLDNAQYLPTRGRYKVYLVDEVHMLSMQSFNALLKTLEEPPAHVKFLLATTDPKKVPVTVLSRCLQFQLKNLPKQEIADYLHQVLQAESVEFESEALGVIARSAAGSMRDALSLTDQAIAYGQGRLLHDDVVAMLGVVGHDEVNVLLGGIAAGSADQVMSATAELAARNADFVDVLKGVVESLHHRAVALATSAAVDEPFSAEELQLYYQIALIGYRDISIAPDERSGFEMTMLRMLAFAPNQTSPIPPREQIQADVKQGQNATNEADLDEGAGAEKKKTLNRADNAASNSYPPGAEIANANSAVSDNPANNYSRSDHTSNNHNSAASQNDAANHRVSQASITPQTKNDCPHPANESTNKTKDARHFENGEGRNLVSNAAASVGILPTTENSLSWSKMSAELAVAGVTKMIAEHSNLLSMELPGIELLLDEGHDTLLNVSLQAGLGRALGSMLGQEVNLTINTGKLFEETPALQKVREQKERQIAAEQAINNDHNVLNLLAEFGGRVEQIKPN